MATEVKELFVSGVGGVGFLHGVVTVTLTVVRAHDLGGKKAKMSRVVVGRLALTNAAANDLLNELRALSANLKKLAPGGEKKH